MATQAELSEAKAARHKLMTGTKAAKVTMNGRTVEYAPADLNKLDNYISRLEAELSTTDLRRPARVLG